MTRLRRAVEMGFLASAVAALAIRVLSIAEPLGIDQSLWASAVRGLSRHQLLYRDVWEQRPPGIYFTYLAGFTVFGWAPAAVAWLDVLASAVTTLLLFAIARKLSSVTIGAMTAALYAALTMPAWLYRHDGFLERSVCETFIVVCVALSAWCAVRFRTRPSLALAAGVGLFGGAAAIYKPNAALYLPAMLSWLVFYGTESTPKGRGSLIRPLVAAVLASAIVPLLTLLWLWRLELLADARIAVVDFNRFYVAQGFTFSGFAIDFSKAVWLRMKTDPLWLGGGVGAVVVVWDLAKRRRLAPLPGLAVAWGGAAALVIIVNGARLYNTYFIQAFAPLAVMTAWLLGEAIRGPFSRRLLSAATAGLMLVVLAERHYPAKVYDWARADLDVRRGRLDRTTYLERFGGYANERGYSARANEELAAYVHGHSTFDDRIFLFGINGAGVYFLSNRLPAHRFLRVNFFVPSEFPDPHFTLAAVVDDLLTRRPRYLIFEALHSRSAMATAVDALQLDPTVTRLLEHYRLESTIEDFTIYRLVEPPAGPAP
jgi:hypothetical protein